MDLKSLVLEISSDEDGDSLDDCNWFTELFGEANKDDDDDSDAVVVVSESLKKSKLKPCSVELDDDDDCVVLDKDPNEDSDVRNRNCGKPVDVDVDDDILLVSEKGQVACRDYPHSRHLCIKFPFSSTPNQSHCNQCYCYVCDLLAPCVYWGNGTGSTDHCHATDKDEFWKLKRKNSKNGCKTVQPVTQPPPGNLQTPPLAPLQNQIANPGLIHAYHSSANSQYRNIPSQYINNVLALRTKVHPGLASQGLRAHQKYNLGSRVQRPVFKRTGPVRVATTANPNPYGLCRGNIGNLIRKQNNQVNGMLSRSDNYLGSLQPNAVKASVQYPSQSPTNTSSTVNPQPLHQLQVSNHLNPNFQSHVNYNPNPEIMSYQQLHPVPPLSSFIPQPASGQPSYMVPVQPSYTVPAQPSYPAPPKTRVDSPVVPASDFTESVSQGDQARGPVVDSGFTDYSWDWPAGQDSATAGDTGSTGTSLAIVSGGLADYQYDWIFDDQPIEPGFTDYSSDSAFIDTGPIFDF